MTGAFTSVIASLRFVAAGFGRDTTSVVVQRDDAWRELALARATILARLARVVPTPPRLSAGGRVVISGGTDTRVERVPLHMISVPDNYCDMDEDHVADVARHLRAGHDSPPVLLVPREPESGYWLIEGRHRYVGALVAGRADVLAVIVERIEIIP